MAPLDVKDLDGDGKPGLTSWPWVALVLGLVLIVCGTIAALMLSGTVTFEQISGVVWALVGAGAAGGGTVAHRAMRQ